MEPEKQPKKFVVPLLSIIIGLLLVLIGFQYYLNKKQKTGEGNVNQSQQSQVKYKNSLGIGELPIDWSVVAYDGQVTKGENGRYIAAPDFICTVGECGDGPYYVRLTPYKGADIQKKIDNWRKNIKAQQEENDNVSDEFVGLVPKESATIIDGQTAVVFSDYNEKAAFSLEKTYLVRWQNLPNPDDAYSLTDRGLEIVCSAEANVCDHFVQTFSRKALDEAADYMYGWYSTY